MAEEEPKGAPLWMCTFSDMMSLLLCFFVLLFSLSTIEQKKWVMAKGSFQAGFGGQGNYVKNMPPNPDESTQDLSKVAPPKNQRYFGKNDIVARLRQKSKTWKLDDKIVEIKGTEKGIRFVISGDALFKDKSAKISPEAHLPLQFVADALVDLPSNPIRIVGHTDDRPPPPEEFPSNWELSAARARTVMDFITYDYPVDEGRFRYEGAADVRPRLKPGKSEADRVLYDYEQNPDIRNLREMPYYSNNIKEEAAMNRRVELLLLQTDESDKFGWYADFKNEKAQERFDDISEPAGPLE